MAAFVVVTVAFWVFLARVRMKRQAACQRVGSGAGECTEEGCETDCVWYYSLSVRRCCLNSKKASGDKLTVEKVEVEKMRRGPDT
jgi:hypothetical protein